ncbi:MAG TPA: hypothetical protein VM490_14360 [Armatimonadaceae bacterium]|nr:hypothetical protein [Armatimonadaceae bacterium]
MRDAPRQRRTTGARVWLLAGALLLAAQVPDMGSVYAQTAPRKKPVTAKKPIAVKKPVAKTLSPALSAVRRSRPKSQDPLQRRTLSALGKLKTGKQASVSSSSSALRSGSRVGLPDVKAGTSPLDRWSMTRQKPAMRAGKKSTSSDDRGRSLLPKP